MAGKEAEEVVGVDERGTSKREIIHHRKWLVGF